MIAVDTNVLVYAVDANETLKGPRAVALLEEIAPQQAILLWQVVCEFGAALSRRQAAGQFRIQVPEVVDAWLEIFPLALPTRAVLSTAWRLQSQFQVSYWDAMLLAACRDAGVTRLYTEDLQSRPIIEGIEIVNPFALR
jgi:predicted nucleic acid-binding protein